MTLITRMFRSLANPQSRDNGFELYYGTLVRNQAQGGPTAAEARRDYRSVRTSIERISLL